jgi:hypothetical protein
MSNAEIILGNCLLVGIMENVDTYAGWNTKGYKIKAGSKAVFTDRIWKPCKVKNEKTGEPENKLILVKASFFTESQVIKVN